MIWIEAIGWAAAGFTVATYAMKTMLPLRIFAIMSSFCFLIYAALLPNWPMLAMELILLPFNVWRFLEILIKRRQVAAARSDTLSVFALLRSVGKARRFATGKVVFERGDPPDHLYFIESGEVVLDELKITLGPGEIFGEIAFFTDAKARTATARCQTDCKIHAIDETAFLDLYFINPGFAVALIRLITRRLIEGVAQRPELYRSSSLNIKAPNHIP